MSHTLRKVNLGNSTLAESTIIDYVAGGESYTLAELGITGALVSVVFLVPNSFTDDGTLQLIPRLKAGKIVVENALNTEIPAKVGLNYTFIAIVHGT